MKPNIRPGRAALVAVVVFFLLLSLLTLLGCGGGDGTETSVGMLGDVRTVTHEGHRFVTIIYNGKPGGILHHPDCCKK